MLCPACAPLIAQLLLLLVPPLHLTHAHARRAPPLRSATPWHRAGHHPRYQAAARGDGQAAEGAGHRPGAVCRQAQHAEAAGQGGAADGGRSGRRRRRQGRGAAAPRHQPACHQQGGRRRDDQHGA
eukprot:1789010-Prymnesium_polylepis.2